MSFFPSPVYVIYIMLYVHCFYLYTLVMITIITILIFLYIMYDSDRILNKCIFLRNASESFCVRWLNFFNFFFCGGERERGVGGKYAWTWELFDWASVCLQLVCILQLSNTLYCMDYVVRAARLVSSVKMYVVLFPCALVFSKGLELYFVVHLFR